MAKKSDNKIVVGIKDMPESFRDLSEPSDTSKLVEVVKEDDDATHPVLLISSLDHPVTLSYNGQGMILAPRARRTIANEKKLGALPKGITKISQTK